MFNHKLLWCIILPMLFDILKSYTSPYLIVLIVVLWMLLSQIKWNHWYVWKGLQAVHVKSSSNPEVIAQIVGCKFHFIFSSPELLLNNYDWTDVFQSSSKKHYNIYIPPCYLTSCIIRTFIMWLLQLIEFHCANFINNSFSRCSLLVERLHTRLGLDSSLISNDCYIVIAKQLWGYAFLNISGFNHFERYHFLEPVCTYQVGWGLFLSSCKGRLTHKYLKL